ncbi:MAG TPA: squalene synthase HpnC [Elusimicrobiota bacterium]|jgi:squalene synthase HpnC|nr:squalene synthase HpnC [Elusimicrobiota bacterium]
MNTLEWYEAPVRDPKDAAGAYDFCQRLANAHYENFPVASRFVARPLRRHVAALYAFARIADDFADEREYEGVRKERLLDWRAQLNAVGKAPARHPVFVALESTFAELELPLKPFDDLLDAFLQDTEKSRYATWDEVLDYCRRSADPVGRIVLMIHGYRDPELFKLSDRICSALQVANFLQDVSVDLKKDRIYLPEEDLREFGYSEADLRMGVVNERFRDVMKRNWKRTRALFEEGRALPSKLACPLSWEIKLTWMGGTEILRKVSAQGFDTLHARPALSRWDWPRLLWGTLTS